MTPNLIIKYDIELRDLIDDIYKIMFNNPKIECRLIAGGIDCTSPPSCLAVGEFEVKQLPKKESEEPMKKFCINCEHHRNIVEEGYYTHRCARKQQLNLVSGEEITVSCWLQREDSSHDDHCGEEGKYFISKKEKISCVEKHEKVRDI